MSKHAFLIVGERVIPIANPAGAGLQYQAQSHVLMPQAQVGPRCQETAETIIVVREGTVEVMVNGASGIIVGGTFVRVPAGTWYAYRNVGDDAARILCRTAPASPPRETYKISISLSAA